MNRPVAYCLVTLLMPMNSIMVDKNVVTYLLFVDMSCIVVQSFQMIRHMENRITCCCWGTWADKFNLSPVLLHDRYSPWIGDPALASQLSNESTKCCKILLEFQIFQIRAFALL